LEFLWNILADNFREGYTFREGCIWTKNELDTIQRTIIEERGLIIMIMFLT
jgi:hypothetical protein